MRPVIAEKAHPGKWQVSVEKQMICFFAAETGGRFPGHFLNELLHGDRFVLSSRQQPGHQITPLLQL